MRLTKPVGIGTNLAQPQARRVRSRLKVGEPSTANPERSLSRDERGKHQQRGAGRPLNLQVRRSLSLSPFTNVGGVLSILAKPCIWTKHHSQLPEHIHLFHGKQFVWERYYRAGKTISHNQHEPSTHFLQPHHNHRFWLEAGLKGDVHDVAYLGLQCLGAAYFASTFVYLRGWKSTHILQECMVTKRRSWPRALRFMAKRYDI